MRKLFACCLSLAFACPVFADVPAARQAFEKKDFAAALKEVQPLADKGDANACLMLGLMNAEGKGVKRSADEAIRLITMAIQGKADFSLRWLNGHTALTWAIDAGKLDLAEQIMQAGADINQVGDEDRSPLFFAAKEGKPELVQKLLEKGAKADLADKDGDLPLHAAVEVYTMEKAKAIIDLLLSKSSINAQNKEGETALLEALDNGKKEMALYLVEKGADLNLADTEGKVPLFCIIDDFEGPEALELLTALAPKGLKFDTTDKRGRTVLHELAGKADKAEALEKAQSLISAGAGKVNINAADAEGVTPLLLAVQERSDEGSPVPFVTWLLEQGADPKAASKSGFTALHQAIDPRTPDISLQLLDLLLAKNADVNHLTGKKQSALHLLARASSEAGAAPLAKKLLEKGAKPDLIDADGDTPLHIAADQRDKPEVAAFAEALLAQKADPNLRDSEQRTPMHIAARTGGRELVRVLLAKGADPAQLDKYKDTPAKIAEENGNQEIYAMIRDRATPAPTVAPTGPLAKADQEKRAEELYAYAAKLGSSDLDTIAKTLWEVADRCPETTQAPDALWKLSNLYLTGPDKPDYDQAQKALEKLASGYPTFQPALPVDSALPAVQKRLGFIAEKKENWDKVIELYEPLFKDLKKLNDGDCTGFGLILGDAYAKKGQKEKGRPLFEEIMRRYDKNRSDFSYEEAKRRLDALK